MDLELVVVMLNAVNCILPVGHHNIAVVARKALSNVAKRATHKVGVLLLANSSDIIRDLLREPVGLVFGVHSGGVGGVGGGWGYGRAVRGGDACSGVFIGGESRREEKFDGGRFVNSKSGNLGFTL